MNWSRGRAVSTLDFRMPNQLPREEPTQQRSFWSGLCGVLRSREPVAPTRRGYSLTRKLEEILQARPHGVRRHR
jgi:hypothetical protein